MMSNTYYYFGESIVLDIKVFVSALGGILHHRKPGPKQKASNKMVSPELISNVRRRCLLGCSNGAKQKLQPVYFPVV